MDLSAMIEAGIEKAGGNAALARAIGVHPNNLTNAKKGLRGLPLDACGRLAEIIGIDRWTVAAASELVTERNPERRAYLTPFVTGLARAASIAGIALVTTVNTTEDAQAAPVGQETNQKLCIMSTMKSIVIQIASRFCNTVRAVFQPPHFGAAPALA